jgi:hypothetical protein
MEIILWPFKLIWQLLSGILQLTGRLVAVVLGLVVLIVGAVLSATGLGACIGIPLMAFGALLIARGLF